MLLPQFLNRCQQSYKGRKFHEKVTKKVQVSVVFSCRKMTKKKQYLAGTMADRTVQCGIISH